MSQTSREAAKEIALLLERLKVRGLNADRCS